MKKLTILILSLYIGCGFLTNISHAEKKLPDDVLSIIREVRNHHSEPLDFATLRTQIPDMFISVFRKMFQHIPSHIARDTTQLDGKTADFFLKNHDCQNSGTVFTSIDDQGNPVCKERNAKFLVKVIEGTVESGVETKQIHRTGDSIAFNTPIRIRTTNENATLQFPEDKSIIRLASKTGIRLSPVENRDKNDPKQSLAQVTLDGGILWGRVLNNANVEFRSGDVIAGVRGTSIALIKEWNTDTIEIIDSQNPESAILRNEKNNNTTILRQQDVYSIWDNTTSHTTKEAQWNKKWFFKESAKADIAYMNQQNTDGNNESIQREIDVSSPKNENEKNTICKENENFWKTAKTKQEVCQPKSLVISIKQNNWKMHDSHGTITGTKNGEFPELEISSIKLNTHPNNTDTKKTTLQVDNIIFIFKNKVKITNNKNNCITIQKNQLTKIQSWKNVTDLDIYTTVNCQEK